MREWIATAEELYDYAGPERFHVSVDDAAVKKYAASIAHTEFRLPEWRDAGIHPADDQKYIDFVFFSSAVNFCFSHPRPYPPFPKYQIRTSAGKIISGAYAMASCVTRLAECSPHSLVPALDKRIASVGQTKAFFNRRAICPIPLAKARYENIRIALGNLYTAFRGSVENVFEFAGYDAVRLVHALVTYFPKVFGDDYYADHVTGKRIIFAKRAQLLALLYEGRAQSSNGRLRPLSSIEAIGPIVDYHLPRIPHQLGLLRYSPDLVGAITSSVIQKNSDHEIGLRVGALLVVDRLLDAINALRPSSKIHMGHLDYFLWSQAMTGGLPHHVTKTTAY